MESASHTRDSDSHDIKRSTPEVTEFEVIDEETSSPITRINITDFIKQYVHPLHEQFKEGLQVEHENKLAEESRKIYCELLKVKRNQAILLAQTNGILAAAALGLTVCARLKGLGQTILVQQCAAKKINITAVETECGFQPYFSLNEMNYTVGTDGWSMHPFSDCFWKGVHINLNGKTFTWQFSNNNGDWLEQEPSIHFSHLDLITEFQEVKLNDFNYELKAHPAHNLNDLENINILNDLIGRIEDSNSNSLGEVVISRQQNTDFGNMFTWTDKLKIMIIVIIIFIFLLLSIKICLRYITITPKLKKYAFFKRTKDVEKSQTEAMPMLTFPTRQATPSVTESNVTRTTDPTTIQTARAIIERHAAQSPIPQRVRFATPPMSPDQTSQQLETDKSET